MSKLDTIITHRQNPRGKILPEWLFHKMSLIYDDPYGASETLDDVLRHVTKIRCTKDLEVLLCLD